MPPSARLPLPASPDPRPWPASSWPKLPLPARRRDSRTTLAPHPHKDWSGRRCRNAHGDMTPETKRRGSDLPRRRKSRLTHAAAAVSSAPPRRESASSKDFHNRLRKPRLSDSSIVHFAASPTVDRMATMPLPSWRVVIIVSAGTPSARSARAPSN